MNTAAAPKNVSKAIDQWLDIHFGDTSFNGRVILGHRKPGKRGLSVMGVRSLTNLRPYVKLIQASEKTDYYITANTVIGAKRRKDDLFGLQNIVIDIDCHDGSQPQHVSALVQAFIWRCKRDLWDEGVIPTPNSIVRTGRGVQLWWALVPCYGGKGYDTSLQCHQKIKSNFVGHIEELLDEHEEELGKLSVDSGASSNLVGWFRLPCTYNTKARRYGSLEILHTQRYDQRELIRLDPPSRATTEARDAQYVPLLESDRFILKGYQTMGVRRVIQLIKLRNLRNNAAGSESRNNFNFSVYNALRMSLDHDEAMARVRAFNAGFRNPMTDEELENCICTAKKKNGYSYSNAKLVELLEITPEEQNIIGLFPASRKRKVTPNASRDAARTALREDRNQKILELLGKGVSQAETARILGIGKNTVGRFVKKMRADITEQIGRHQNGSIYVLCEGVPVVHKYTDCVSTELRESGGGVLVLPVYDSDSS